MYETDVKGIAWVWQGKRIRKSIQPLIVPSGRPATRSPTPHQKKASPSVN
jgi:hypothetical protein